MSERWARAMGSALAGVFVALVGLPVAASAQVLLQGGTPGIILKGNDFQCGVRNDGATCADLGDSASDPGGFWPTGSPNAYMFNSGIMIAGILAEEAGNPWAGDTVGAYFFNASGGSAADAITNVWNSLDDEDLANWPEAGSISQFPWLSAYVTDEDLFATSLLGSKAASQQDSWVVYWDGNPDNANGPRAHPAGLLVEQRSLAWNYPAGNEGTLYFIYNVTNVSNNQYFQQQSEAKFFGGQNALPDAGWTIGDLYMAYAADPDVTADARQNFATAILPFDMGIVYRSDFLASEFIYPPAIFHPPFLTNGPGIIGTKYLQSPIIPGTDDELGLTLFSVYTNGPPFSDPGGSEQLWRYLSGNFRPDLGDDDCTLINPIERRICYVNSEETDVRYYQASGPFSLAPGETTTIVSAMFAAATYSGPGSISQGVDNPPTVTNDEPSVHPGCFGDDIVPIEVASGWVETLECPANEGDPVDIFAVETVPESLLFKAQVAQTIFDNNFLLPFAPRPPDFTLVPGDDRVTVIWEPSPTETEGDPFADAAENPTTPEGDPNPLYNPNFRRFDVEGYRIYRSTDNSTFTLIAQVDKAGTTFVDETCETRGDIPSGEPCPGSTTVPLTGDFIQYPSGGVIETTQGNILIVEADTVGGLTDTGIPYVFTDTTARNGFVYYYQVTAFDVNSLASGPSSLESTSETKSVIPQPAAAGVVDQVDAEVTVLLGDGTVLDPTDNQTLDPVTGQFSGPPPPTDAFSGDFQSVFAALLDAGGAPSVAMELDSVIPAYYAGTYYFSDNSGQVFTIGPVAAPNGTAITDGIAGPAAVPSDEEKADSLEALGVDAPAVAGQVFVNMHFPNTAQWQSGDADWAFLVPGFWEHPLPEESYAGGSRWFDGANESTPDPTIDDQHGALTGVTEIFQPMPYRGMSSYEGFSSDLMRRFYQITWAARRVADIEVRFGAAGEAPEVFDVTHRLPVPYSPAVRASYGFRDDADGSGVVSFGDFWRTPGTNGVDWSGLADDDLDMAPTLGPVDVTGDHAADGNGFAMYIAGEPYIFLTPTIPTNTTWTLRTHSGAVTAPGAGGPYVHLSPTNEPAGVDLFRTPGVPGLRFAVSVNSVIAFDADSIDLAAIRVVPDPYYGASLFDDSPASRNLRIMNLPPRATIRIYTISGVLVDVLNHEGFGGESTTTWDLRNRSGQFVASGVYFYHVTTPEGMEHVGRFTIVNSGFAQ